MILVDWIVMCLVDLTVASINSLVDIRIAIDAIAMSCFVLRLRSHMSMVICIDLVRLLWLLHESPLVEVVIEERLDVDIPLSELMKWVRFLRNFLFNLIILSFPIVLVMLITVVILIMFIMLLLVVHVARMLMLRPRLLVMVEAVLLPISCRETLMLRFVQCLRLFGVLMLVLRVSIGRPPGGMLLVNFTLVDVFNIFSRIASVRVLIRVFKLLVMLHLLRGKRLVMKCRHLSMLRGWLLVCFVMDCRMVINLGQWGLMTSLLERQVMVLVVMVNLMMDHSVMKLLVAKMSVSVVADVSMTSQLVMFFAHILVVLEVLAEIDRVNMMLCSRSVHCLMDFVLGLLQLSHSLMMRLIMLVNWLSVMHSSILWLFVMWGLVMGRGSMVRHSSLVMWGTAEKLMRLLRGVRDRLMQLLFVCRLSLRRRLVRLRGLRRFHALLLCEYCEIKISRVNRVSFLLILALVSGSFSPNSWIAMREDRLVIVHREGLVS